MAIAALDLGRRRIGIALADDVGLVAHPIGAIDRRSIARDLELICTRFVQLEVSQIVVGLPLNMDGSIGARARAATEFAERLRQVSGLPVDLFDERLTSLEAENRLRQVSRTRAHDKGKIDAVAAAIILEGWLEHRGSSR